MQTAVTEKKGEAQKKKKASLGSTEWPQEDVPPPRGHAKINSHGPGRQGRHQHTQGKHPTHSSWMADPWWAHLRGIAVGPAWARVLGSCKMTLIQHSSPHLDRFSQDTWHLYQHILHWSLIIGLLLLPSHWVVSDCLWPHGLPENTPGFSVLHCLQGFAQTHVSDAIQPSHPLLPSSPYALNLSQHQGLKESDQQFNEVQPSPWGHPQPVPEICWAGHSSHQVIGYSLWVQSSGQWICSELRCWGQHLCTYYLLTLGKYRCSWSLSVLTWKREIIRQSCQVIAEKAMAPHSSTLAWKLPWTEEPCRLQSMGSRRVGHDWATPLSLFIFVHWRGKWQPTPVFLPGESQGRGSLVGCHLWGRTESDTTEVT